MILLAHAIAKSETIVDQPTRGEESSGAILTRLTTKVSNEIREKGVLKQQVPLTARFVTHC